jgi:hypothetical protein
MPARSPPAVAGDTLPAGGLLKRSQAAKALGVSVSKLRRMEGVDIEPIVGPDGVRLFRREEIHELTIRRVGERPEQPDQFDGNAAAEVFALLDEGVSAIDIVKRTRLDPRAVIAIRREWVRLQGGFFLAASHLQEIEDLSWLFGTFPIPDAETLLENLKLTSGHICLRCKRHPSDVCTGCARFMSAEHRAKLQNDLAAKREQVSFSKRRARRRREDERLIRRQDDVPVEGGESSATPEP